MARRSEDDGDQGSGVPAVAETCKLQYPSPAGVTQAVERAARIPEQARYDARARLWEQCEFADGNRQGPFQQWRVDGSRYAAGTYDQGKLEGKLERFHPNGELAWQGFFVAGRLEGEVVATACLEQTPERLRECCVPVNAWQMRTLYKEGRSRGDRFFDREGRRLLGDGSLYPERPAHVPSEAWFEEGRRSWLCCTRDAQGRPHGEWRRWSQDGKPCEIGTFDAGKRSGSWQTFSAQGLLLEVAEFSGGVRHGAFTHHKLGAGELVDESIAQISGQLHQDVPVGTWEFRDTAGTRLKSIDLGLLPNEELLRESGVFVDEEDGAWTSVAERLFERRQVGAALCALARHAARTGDSALLRSALSERTVALAPQRGAQLLKGQRGSWVDLVHTLARGAEPAATLRSLASALTFSKRASRDFIEAALLLAGPRPELLLSRALNCIEFADLRGALADAETLSQSDDVAATFVRDLTGVLFGAFRFLPEELELPSQSFEQLPDAPAQPLSSVNAAITKCALRLTEIRTALQRLYAASDLDPVALPPDLSHLLDDGTVELGQWQFEIEEEGSAVQISVDERLKLDRASAVALLSRARAEWTTLCWLCWGAGLTAIAKPASIEGPASFNQALGQAAQRYWRCTDQMTTAGLRSRSQGVPDFVWHGIPISALSGPLLQIAMNEYLEQRAILFWLADPDCQSPWQDDLRPE